MNKKEILQEIREIVEILKMDTDDYTKRIEEKHNHTLKPDAVYPYRTGEAISHLEYILEKA